MKPALSIIIPAKNEESRIARTLATYCSFINNNFDKNDIEIIVVVNNSHDKTSSIVDDYAKDNLFIRKIETTYSTGKGGAVSLGFSEAQGKYIGYIDADGAISPLNFFNLVSFLVDSPKFDGIIGNRTLNNSTASFTRRFIIKLYNFYVKLFFKIDYKDTQCGAKIFKNACARELAHRLSSLGWVFDVNLLLLCKHFNYRIIEKPVKWTEKEGSKFSLFSAVFHLPFEFLYLKRLSLSHYAKVISPFRFLFPNNANPISKKKNNILIFMWRDIKHPDHGGSEIYTFEVAKRLAKDNNVLWFTSRPQNFSEKDQIDGVKIFRKGGMFTVYLWAFLYYLFMFRNKVDLIIDTENGMSFFTPLYARKPIVFIVHHIHGIMWFREFWPPLSIMGFTIEHILMPLVYRKTPIITVSPSSKASIEHLGFVEKKIYLAYNSIVKHHNKRDVKKHKSPLFLYHGRLKNYKRVDLAIKAFAKLLKDFPDAKLIISGEGTAHAKLVDLVYKMRLTEKITFLGYVSDEEKWELMQKAWVFLMPSVVEGWGITVIEAAACGTPTVGFNVSGIKDSVKDNITGLLANDEAQFVDHITALCKNRSLREYLGQNCLYWASLFSWDLTADVVKTVLLSSTSKASLTSDKIYPWDLEMRPDFITSIVS